MQDLYLIIFSIILVLILLLNHIINSKKPFDFYVYCYIFIGITIILFSLINICLLYVNSFNSLKILLLFLGLLLISCPPLAIYYYIKIKLEDKSKNIIGVSIYFFILFFLFIIYYSKKQIIYGNEPLDFLSTFQNKTLFVFIIIPLLYMVITSFYKIIKVKKIDNIYLVIAICSPILALILNISFHISLLIPSYVLSLLCLDLYNSRATFNLDSLTGLYNRRMLDQGI